MNTTAFAHKGHIQESENSMNHLFDEEVELDVDLDDFGMDGQLETDEEDVSEADEDDESDESDDLEDSYSNDDDESYDEAEEDDESDESDDWKDSSSDDDDESYDEAKEDDESDEYDDWEDSSSDDGDESYDEVEEDDEDLLIVKKPLRKPKLAKDDYVGQVGTPKAEKITKGQFGPWVKISIPFIINHPDTKEEVIVEFSANRSIDLKSRLYPVLKGILGTEPGNGIDLRDLAGRKVKISIEHRKDEEGNVWENIVSVRKYEPKR